MTRILVLGGGRHQTPLISRAEARGIEVIVLDYLASSPGHSVASHSEVADATDPAVALQVAETYRVDGVITTGTDIPIRAMAKVSEKLGLSSYVDTAGAHTATDKSAMFQALSSNGVPMAKRVVVEEQDAPASAPIPAVVKPADSQGQRGITAVRDRRDLEGAISIARTASRSGRVLVEEYLDGPEFTANAWIHDGEVALLFVNDRITFNPSPFLGIAFQHRHPSKAAQHLLDPVREITLRVAEAYRIHTGPLYIQMIRSHGQPFVVEAAARVGGGHESRMLLHLTGWSTDDALIDLALGQQPSPPPPLPAAHALVNFILGRQGTVDSPGPMPTTPGILEAGWYVRPGDELSDVTDGQGRVGYFVAEAATSDDLVALAAAYYASLELRSGAGDNLVLIPGPEVLNLP